jgi:hypothetical protein
MTIDFLTPEAVVLAIGAFIPTVFLLDGEYRADRVRLALGLRQAGAPHRRRLAGSIVAVALLVGFAAAQPVLAVEGGAASRQDAEVWYVLDTSRSMLASTTLEAPTRFDRARDDALEIRTELRDVPSGIASLTDRVLPHLFPSDDARVFGAVLDRVVGIDKPPPVSFNVTATTLGALTALATRNYYTREIEHRVVIVFTDAESQPVAAESVGRVFRRPPGVRTMFIRYGNLRERVFTLDGGTESGYRPDPHAPATVRALAAATDGEAFEEGSASARRVADTVRGLLGSGEVELADDERREFPLAPYSIALALLPLGLLIWHRNL